MIFPLATSFDHDASKDSRNWLDLFSLRVSAITLNPPTARTDTIPVAIVPDPTTAARVIPDTEPESVDAGVNESSTTNGTFNSA